MALLPSAKQASRAVCFNARRCTSLQRPVQRMMASTSTENQHKVRLSTELERQKIAGADHNALASRSQS